MKITFPALVAILQLASFNAFAGTYVYHYEAHRGYQDGLPSLIEIAADLKQLTEGTLKPVSPSISIEQEGRIITGSVPTHNGESYFASAKFKVTFEEDAKYFLPRAIALIIDKRNFPAKAYGTILKENASAALPQLLKEIRSPDPSVSLMQLLAEFPIGKSEILQALTSSFMMIPKTSEKRLTAMAHMAIMLKKGALISLETQIAIASALKEPELGYHASEVVIYFSNNANFIADAIASFNSYVDLYFDDYQQIEASKGLYQLIQTVQPTDHSIMGERELLGLIHHPGTFKLLKEASLRFETPTDFLLYALQTKNGKVQKFAANELQISNPKPVFIESLSLIATQAKEVDTRSAAVYALDYIQRKNILPTEEIEKLISLFLITTHDPSNTVRANAALAIGMIGPKAIRAISRLQEMLADEYEVNIYARGAIERILGK